MIVVVAAPRSLAGVTFTWNEPTSLSGSPGVAPAEPAAPLARLSLEPPQAAKARPAIGSRNAEILARERGGNFT